MPDKEMTSLEQAVAELQPGPWKHEVHGHLCVKCKVNVGYIYSTKKPPCPVPDPVHIDDTPECLGRALGMFRAAPNSRSTLYEWYGEKHNMLESLEEQLEIAELASKWMLREANPAQIYEIVVNATEGSKK